MPNQPHGRGSAIQLVEYYRALILSGELADGTRLTPVRQMAEEWGVAHATAAKVHEILRAEGLVTTRPRGHGGTGSFITSKNIGHSPRDRASSVRRTGKIYNAGEHAKIIAAELAPAPDHVADTLGIEPGTTAVRRQRVTYSGQTPVSTSTSWFHPELAESIPELLRLERIKQGTIGAITERTGRTQHDGLDQLTAGTADEATAALLNIPIGSPVLMGRNWFRDSHGETLEFGEYFARPGRWVSYEYSLLNQ